MITVEQARHVMLHGWSGLLTLAIALLGESSPGELFGRDKAALGAVEAFSFGVRRVTCAGFGTFSPSCP